MRIRRSVAWFVLIAAALTALILWFGKKPADKTRPAAAETSPARRGDTRPSQRELHSAAKNSAPAGQAPAGTNALTPAAQTKDEQMRQGLAALNDEQVLLYGRVKDQFGAPVARATIAASVQVNNGTRVGTDRFSLKTEGNGAFTISGHQGKALGLNITKKGYALATPNTRFVYSLLWPEAERHTSDPNNPVVFKMCKLQGAELLVGIDQHYRLEVTGAPVNFDLLAGKIVTSGGDIQITVKRPQGVISEHNQQGWGVLVTAVDGGLIQTTVAESRIEYWAPEAGYKPSCEFVLSTTNHTWSGGIHEMFFVESRGGGAFSKIFLSFNINENPEGLASVTFRGAANTNGSRNWEATVPE